MKAISIALLASALGCTFTHSASAEEPGRAREAFLLSLAGGSSGQTPDNTLLDVKGTLYGTTEWGGAGGYGGVGTVFAIDRKTHTETVVYSFCSQANCADGAFPGGPLIFMGGLLYGATVYGGADAKGGALGTGTIFSLDPATGTETVLHSFYCGRKACKGGSPNSLTKVGDKLYGTTSEGGGDDGKGGTLFEINPRTGKERMIYAFCSQQGCADGESPGFLMNVNGVLYGTTNAGGNGGLNACLENLTGCGVVFSFDPATQKENVIYSFCSLANCTDGKAPNELLDVDGTLYGTTSSGGADGLEGAGTVFSLQPDTGAETVLYSFHCVRIHCKDGGTPTGGLVDLNGTLYGLSFVGGHNGTGGTVFATDPATGTTERLYSFGQGNDGSEPTGLMAVNGLLYGTTQSGGKCSENQYGCGTVFGLRLR